MHLCSMRKTVLFVVGMVVLVALVVLVDLVVLVVLMVCPLVCGQVALLGVGCTTAPTTTLHISRHNNTAAAITNPTVCHQVAPHCNLGLGLTWGPGLTG